MYFSFELKSCIRMSQLKLKNFKKLSQRNIKLRSRFFNSCDSWRKKIYPSKHLNKSSISWSFNSNFFVYLLRQRDISKHSFFGTKPSIYLKINGIKLFQKKYFIILFFKNFFFFFPLYFNTIYDDSKNLFFNKNNSSVEIFNTPFLWLNYSLLLLVKNWFSKTIKVVYNFVFIKLKYKGKNYRWHRKKKGLVLRFGHSHLIYSKKPTSVFLKKKGRMKILFFGTNLSLIRFFLKNLIKWKPSNVYTGRGLRLSKQRLLRKAGKVSAYR